MRNKEDWVSGVAFALSKVEERAKYFQDPNKDSLFVTVGECLMQLSEQIKVQAAMELSVNKPEYEN